MVRIFGRDPSHLTYCTKKSLNGQTLVASRSADTWKSSSTKNIQSKRTDYTHCLPAWIYTKKMKESSILANHTIQETGYLSIKGLRGVSFTQKIRQQLALDELDVLNIEQLGLHSRAVYASDSGKCYITIHGQDFLHAPFPLKVLYKRVIKRPHVSIITISRYLKDLFNKEYPE